MITKPRLFLKYIQAFFRSGSQFFQIVLLFLLLFCFGTDVFGLLLVGIEIMFFFFEFIEFASEITDFCFDIIAFGLGIVGSRFFGVVLFMVGFGLKGCCLVINGFGFAVTDLYFEMVGVVLEGCCLEEAGCCFAVTDFNFEIN